MESALSNRLLELNKQGIIPGINENIENFLLRAEYCLGLKKELETKLSENIPFSNSTLTDSTIALYDISPNWVPLFYSNYQLFPWQGGCAWIFQIDEKSPKAALIQLRQNFQNSDVYLHVYQKQELVCHELAHIGRLAFDEPKFEEFFAYRTSSSRFRKWFGPLVTSSRESLIFILSLALVLVFDLSVITIGNPHLYPYLFWTKSLPIFLMGLAFLRLALRHFQFEKCFQKILKLTKSENKANAAMYRLADREIITFSKMDVKEIQDYITKQKENCLRFKVIAEAYMPVLLVPACVPVPVPEE